MRPSLFALASWWYMMYHRARVGGATEEREREWLGPQNFVQRQLALK